VKDGDGGITALVSIGKTEEAVSVTIDTEKAVPVPGDKVLLKLNGNNVDEAQVDGVTNTVSSEVVVTMIS